VTDRPTQAEGLDINPVADGYVVYDPRTDLVHYLNHTAAMVLEMCTGDDTADDIAAFLAEVFDSAPDVRSAVATCIDQLRDLGLVQPAAGPPASIPAQPPPPDRAENPAPASG
jgi:PqqD family protein of HPr-rel-A system